ncbi:MAG: IS110 family transposase [Candidatus Omnitrophota bacterium]
MAASSLARNKHDVYIGVDVSKNSYSFTAMEADIMYKARTIPASPEHLYTYATKRFPDKNIIFAYEAGPTGYRLYDYLTVKNYGCLVVPPNSIPKASNERVKNNNIDARKITQNLQAGQLTSIRVPQGAYRELRHLIKARENYAQSRRVAKQRIKALLLFESLNDYLKDADRSWSHRYLESLKTIPCSPAVRSRLDMLLDDLEYARHHILASHSTLQAFIKEQPSVQENIGYLRSIPGIGFVTAVSLLGKIGDPAGLTNVRELGSFIGLTSRENSTGDTVHRGGISHFGNAYLRFLMVEASWVAIRKDAELHQFYYRIKRRHHPRYASQKAIVAVARKLTHRIYRVLKDKRMYCIH